MMFKIELLYFHGKQVKAHQKTNATGLLMGRWVHGLNLPMNFLDVLFKRASEVFR